MTGDFTNPDPAVPSEESGSVPEQSEEPLDDEFDAVELLDDSDSELFVVDNDASCLKCEHFEVCAVYSGIRPMLQDWHTSDSQEAEPPIDIEKLAWHCRKYSPKE